MENKFSDLPKQITEIIEQKIDEVAAECETYEEVRMKLIKDQNFFSGSVGYTLVEKHIIKRALLQRIERPNEKDRREMFKQGTRRMIDIMNHKEGKK